MNEQLRRSSRRIKQSNEWNTGRNEQVEEYVLSNAEEEQLENVKDENQVEIIEDNSDNDYTVDNEDVKEEYENEPQEENAHNDDSSRTDYQVEEKSESTEHKFECYECRLVFSKFVSPLLCWMI